MLTLRTLAVLLKRRMNYQLGGFESMLVDIVVEEIDRTINARQYRRKHNVMVRQLHAAIVGKRLYERALVANHANFDEKLRNLLVEGNWNEMIKSIRIAIQEEMHDLK